MFATFNNRLEIRENAYDAPRVIYGHERRMNVKIFIDYAPASGRDWRISLEGDRATIHQVSESVSREIHTYLKQRSGKKFAGIKFMDILNLASMPSIA